jgi:hypothetical protein
MSKPTKKNMKEKRYCSNEIKKKSIIMALPKNLKKVVGALTNKLI